VTASPVDPHDIDNQPPEFAARDLWADDAALREGIEREGAVAFADRLHA
jgi:putative acyl-CoA dehydrogenase